MAILQEHQNIRKINSYITGGSIYFSTVHPFSLNEVSKIKSEKINVILSFMDEYPKPRWYSPALLLLPNVRHYYYPIKYPISDHVFDVVYPTIFIALENGQNVLLQCRNEYHHCVLFFCAFLIRSLVHAQHYTVINYLHFIPKCRTNWTDSLIDFLEKLYSFLQIRKWISKDELDRLYLYENHVFSEPKKLFKFSRFF